MRYCRHDVQLMAKLRPSQKPQPSLSDNHPQSASSSAVFHAQLPTQQFGVSLQFIRDHSPPDDDFIPPVVRHCVEFLGQPDGNFLNQLEKFNECPSWCW
jgi:hypothetical protein